MEMDSIFQQIKIVHGQSFVVYILMLFLKIFFFSFSNSDTRKIKPIYVIYEVNTISLFETIPSKN